MGGEVLTVLGGVLLAALSLFFVRIMFAPQIWTPAGRASARRLADFLQAVSATLVGVVVVGSFLGQYDGRIFVVSRDAPVLSLAALVLLIASMLVSAMTAED